ncbi:MAG: alpha/beta hydrolase [Sideroxyarcus sp.]|nr:alpha/beta hydrolase [Sideroxyarcus sp.]
MKHLKLLPFMLALLLALTGNSANAGLFRDRAAQGTELEQDDDSASGSTPLPPGTKLLKDIAYGEADAQKMDVYLPAHAEHAPVILMVHGGGWRRGDKTMSQVVDNKAARWVAQGFIFISINYRMLPKADVLTQADDVARALAAAQSRAAAWGGDPARFILMGHSAGAHLVALLSAAPARAQAQGARSWPGTVVLDSAALDAVKIMQSRHYRLYDKAFGKDEAFWKSASPFHVLSATATPMLLVCSTTRPDKPCDQADAFAARAAALGIRAEVSGQALSHKEVNQKLGLPGAYTDTVELFMRSLGVVRF